MFKRIFTVCAVLTAVLISPKVSSQIFNDPAAGKTFVVDDALAKQIVGELSGVRALEHIYRLSEYDRSGASQGYRDAIQYVMKIAGEIGLDDVHIEKFPADGETEYLGYWKAGYGWEKRSASLSLVYPYKNDIISYDIVPTMLAKYSHKSDVTAELIDVGEGVHESDYVGKEVAGKIVLTSSPARQVMEIAVIQKGAAGVISHWSNYDPKRDRYPDQIPWQSVRQRFRDNYFAFSVSRNIAEELKTLLRNNDKVTLRAVVDAESIETDYEILSARIPGRIAPEKEVVFTSHINHYKPGANDNASGCALSLEIARAVMSLIKKGEIDYPNISMRFLWLREHQGSLLYIDRHKDLAENGIININLDMVGENILKCESRFRITLTPDACPGFLNDLLTDNAEYISAYNFTERGGVRIPFTYSLEPYNGAISDHYWFVSGGVSIPGSLLFNWPDNYYHSQEDTPDKCDPTQLKRIGFLSMATALISANADNQTINRLTSRVAAGSSARITRITAEGIRLLLESSGENIYDNYKVIVNKLEKNRERDKIAIEKIYKICFTQSGNKTIKTYKNQFAIFCANEISRIDNFYKERCESLHVETLQIRLTDKEKYYSKYVPKRNTYGPIPLGYIADKLGEERYQWYVDAENRIRNFFVKQDEFINFIDGKRSITDIRNFVAAEFGEISIEDVYEYINGFVEIGLISWNE